LNFPGDEYHVSYREGVFVGYRYYDYKKIDVLFPFGHGLSYTTFAYSNLKLSKTSISDTEELKVTVDITNTGSRAGKEIVQLYVQDRTNTTIRPLRELKGFEKVELNPGETKTVEFSLNKRSFASYSESLGDWYCASGDYDIVIGSSSRDLRLTQTVHVDTQVLLPFVVDLNTTVNALLNDPRTKALATEVIFGDFNNRNKKPGEMSVTSKAVDEKRRRIGQLEKPMRYLHLQQGIPYEEVTGLIERLNREIEAAAK
jgi:beta-glucosidase